MTEEQQGEQRHSSYSNSKGQREINAREGGQPAQPGEESKAAAVTKENLNR